MTGTPSWTLAILFAGIVPPLHAGQQDTSVTRDTTAVPDSSALQDTVAVGPQREHIPLQGYELESPDGPLTPGSRYVFTRDSINWSTAHTLGDLLTTIPGVYLARTGWIGQPEYAQYGGRGGSGIEIYWDGMPMYAVGGDSLSMDPGTFYLRYLRRVDVEVLPGLLRVYLMSERHNQASPRSLIRATPGSFNTASYTGLFQTRWQSGITIDVAAQSVAADGFLGDPRKDRLFDIWARVGWIPTPGVSVAYQVRRQNIDSDPKSTTSGGDGVAGRFGTRQDAQFVLSTGGSTGLGVFTNLGLAFTSWTPDSAVAVPKQNIRQVFAGLKYKRRTWSAEVRGAHADQRNPFRIDGRVGWVPIPSVVVSGDVEWLQHEGDRTSTRIHASAGLYRGPFALVADVAQGSWVQAPAILTDTAIATFDSGLRFHFTSRPLTGHVGVVRRDAFAPLAYPELTAIPAFAPSTKADYLVTSVQLRPMAALTFSGWYSNPVRGVSADLQPPTHGRVQITLRSKFWRTFRSGAFDLKLQVATESWSSGTAGLDAQGTPIVLNGGTFWEYHVAIQLLSFTAFWNLRNARLSNAVYVPGLAYPKNAQTFGITWVFAN